MKVHTLRKKRSAAGLVSIMITLVMMLVITMIVIGFAQISRREQRQSLDRQLSAQAFLAAETGVNDARKVLHDAIKVGAPIPEKDVCVNDPDPQAAALNALNSKSVVDANNSVAYSCLLVDTTLPNIIQELDPDVGSVVIPIRPVVPGPITRLQIKWKGSQTATNASCTPNVRPFTTAGSWPCDYGLLRMDIVPTTNLTRSVLMGSQKAFFLYPTRQSGGPVPQLGYSTTTRGATTGMTCITANDDCRINITALGATSYALRLGAVYKPGTVEIIAENAAGPVDLIGAQALVDVTGRAQDVLRRIQVRLSLNGSNGNPDYAVQSGGAICKRFGVSQTTFSVASDIAFNDVTNPMCQD